MLKGSVNSTRRQCGASTGDYPFFKALFIIAHDLFYFLKTGKPVFTKRTASLRSRWAMSGKLDRKEGKRLQVADGFLRLTFEI